MTEVPDTSAEALRIEAAYIAHMSSPEQVAAYLHCMGMSVATAKAEYAEASARYWATGELSAAEDALRAADEWKALGERIGACMDDLKSTERSVRARQAAPVVLSDYPGRDIDGDHVGSTRTDAGVRSAGEGEPDRPRRGRVGAVLARVAGRGADAPSGVGVGAVHRRRGPRWLSRGGRP